MKQIIVLLLSAIVGVTIMSCKESGTNPPEEKPPGYQEDIPWPSLADSPWPMGHHDPQSTGRSKFLGPQNGNLNVLVDSMYITTGISVDGENNLYFLSGYSSSGLYSYTKLGFLKWKLDSLADTYVKGYTTPTLDSEGILYTTSWLYLIAISKEGNPLWSFTADDLIVYSSLSIDKEGNIYFVSRNSTLYSISKSGQLNWKLQDSRFNTGSWINGISISPDGKTLYVPGKNPSLLAVNIASQKVTWTFGETILVGSALIDSRGFIYLQSKVSSINNNGASLFCLNPDGSVKWSYLHNNLNFNSSTEPFIEGTMDKNGNYYFAFDTLYSIDYSGKLRWKVKLGSTSVVPLISDVAGNIYVICESAPEGIIVYSFSSQGIINWSSIISDFVSGFMGSPSINSAGELIIPRYRGKRIYNLK